ncbi:MAG: CoA-binding protein, partial [Deltaproteobacteria bacterium]|nr:CoA-binding protein [Deltaproteobacteria bacterium]
MSEGISSILSPKSIAVVGATDRAGSVGIAVFDNLLNARFQGVVYPVNPRTKSVCGVRSYPSLLDIPDDVDMAVIIVPSAVVPEVVDQAAEKGVRGLVVITAGFKETGGQGVELENQLKEKVWSHGIRMIGPNCLGVMNTDPSVRLNASFANKNPKHGGIGFISQSGALCTSVLDYAEGRNIGFSKFISFGNKADVNEVDLLEYLRDDSDTHVILMYLEDISDGHRFIEVCREITWDAHKPILAVKSGRSAEGARAAASHTGSLAGSDLAYDAIFTQSGIMRVESINELFNYAIAFSRQPVPRGKRIAIITNAGGPGIMTTDAAVRHGLELASFSESTLGKLEESLPPTAAINNPVDVIGDADHERYGAALGAILDDDGVDAAIVILTPTAMTDVLETAEMVVRVTGGSDKPILCSFMGIVDVSEGVRYLENHGIPNYVFPEAAVRAMAAMQKFGKQLTLPKREVRRVAADKDAAAQIIRRRLEGRQRHFMPEHEANEILQVYGFPVLKGRLVKDLSEVEAAIEEVGVPVAMKIASPDIVHKFEA